MKTIVPPLAVFVVLGVHLVTAQVRLAEVAGTLTDQSGAVLPGVLVTVTQAETGNSRSTSSSGDGTYRFNALPVGTYEFRAELQGFNPVVIRDYRLDIGQSAVLNIQMKLATLQESVTVLAEAPLIETTKSDLAGRVDKRQVEDLPVNGRNWLVFSVLAPGVKSDGSDRVGSTPTSGIGDFRFTKVFVDGADVQNRATKQISMEVSKEIMDQFEVITNRFDAQMGHGGTTIVNAVTKSGTERFGGSAFLFFRDDALSAKDFFTRGKEPYRNEQYGGTVGGPLISGKAHFFLSYERQVEPKTVSTNTGFSLYDEPVDGSDKRNLYFLRGDYSVTANHRLTGRFNAFTRFQPNLDTGGLTPSSNSELLDQIEKRYSFEWNSVFGSNWVNRFLFTFLDSLRKFEQMSPGSRHTFPSLTVGGAPGPGHEIPSYWFVREDLAYYFEKAGKHNIKFGGEYEHGDTQGFFGFARFGLFFYDEDPPNLATCCVDLDQSKWDKSLFPPPVQYTQALGDFSIMSPNDIYSLYFHDDWTINNRLTLNLGVRWDAEFGSLANDNTGLSTRPHPNDVDNFQPRIGFAWDVTGQGKTILRGGGGLYYDQVFLNLTFNQIRSNSGQLVEVTVFNPTGDPNFANDPLGGRTFEDFQGTLGAQNVIRIAPDTKQPSLWTWSFGVAHELSPVLAISADYVGQRSDSMLRSIESNLFCCTPDGNALPPRSGFFPELGGQVEGAGVPDPRFNSIQEYVSKGKSRYHGLQVALNKRWSRSYQFGLTYLLSKNEDDHNGPFFFPNNNFNLGDEFGTSVLDQRHRLVANWVSQLPKGLIFSGIVYAASGQAVAVSAGGVDVNGDGIPSRSSGDRPICGVDPRFNAACSALGVPEGQRVPRNSIRSDAVFRTDLRVSRPLTVSRTRIEPIFEVFNVLNRENHDPLAYNRNLLSPGFGQPGRSRALPYLPRQIQLAVRVTF